MYLIYDEILEDYQASEMAEEMGCSEEEAAAQWFSEVGSESEWREEERKPKYNQYVDDIPEIDAELYYDYGAGYYFAVKKTEGNDSPMTISESMLKKVIMEAANKVLNEISNDLLDDAMDSAEEKALALPDYDPRRKKYDRQHSVFRKELSDRWNRMTDRQKERYTINRHDRMTGDRKYIPGKGYRTDMTQVMSHMPKKDED